VNVRDDDWCLLLGWLVGAVRAAGPYPVLGLHGEQGSAKTTTARVLSQLVDPSTVPVRAAPRDERDLMIAATNRWLVNLDNLSHMPAWLSDAICRLATGGGFTTRELYTDADEVLFNAQRPVIINGIDEVATRSDLLDRAILLNLPTIAPDRRRSEREFWDAFGDVQPRIIGALLDAVSCALRQRGETRLRDLPRMADFALWATAAEPALGFPSGSFSAAYSHNRAQGAELAIDASIVGQALMEIGRNGFEGTASELLELLSAMAGDRATCQREWPKNARSLSAKVKWLAHNLRAVGCPVEWDRDSTRDRSRIIRLGICVHTVHRGAGPAGQAPAADARGRNVHTSDASHIPSHRQNDRLVDAPNASDHADANLDQLVHQASERARTLGYPGVPLSPGRRVPPGRGALAAFLRSAHAQAQRGDATALRDLKAVLDALSEGNHDE
jgi:hypothetical protein